MSRIITALEPKDEILQRNGMEVMSATNLNNKTVEVDSIQYDQKNTSVWSWLGTLVLWFIVFTVLFWLIFYSLKPPFVLVTGSNKVDTAKVLLYSVISSLILIIVICIIKRIFKYDNTHNLIH